MFAVIFNIFVFALLILFIARQMKSGLTLSKQILIGLFFGIFLFLINTSLKAGVKTLIYFADLYISFSNKKATALPH